MLVVDVGGFFALIEEEGGLMPSCVTRVPLGRERKKRPPCATLAWSFFGTMIVWEAVGALARPFCKREDKSQHALDAGRSRTTHGNLSGSSDGSLARSDDLDNIAGSSVLDVLGVDDLASGGVVVPSRHDDLDAMLALKLLERRSALADDGRVERVRDGDSVDDARLEARDLLREESVDLLGDGLGSGDSNRVGTIALAREANGVARSAGVAGSSGAGDEVADWKNEESV